jgi:hypothetical protein
MADPAAFAKLVPGFDFLQGLVKNAGSSLPGMSQWIAPTLDPEELEKRIRDLRTVQFWLEQNAKMIAATIQALEVQRMTLSTLKSMNLPIDAVRETLQIRPAEEAAPAPKPAPRPAKATKAAPAAEAAPAIDPMQWWGALTQQFSELAAKTLKDLPAAGVPAAPAPAPAKKGAARPRRKAG